MNQYRRNRIKALILLTIFSLNTVVGFACSVGINMGYNAGHHKHSSTHSHKHASSHSKGHSHSSGHKHTHEHGAQNNQDDCCANDVTKFIKLDKSVANPLHIEPPLFSMEFISTYLQSSQIDANSLINSRFQFVRRSCFLNDTDIRISIQSFQI